jgi:transposase
VSRAEISDEAWAVIGPLFPVPKAMGRPPVDRRSVVEATVWRFRTGSPWREVPERFGNWNTIYKNFNRWAEQGVWTRALEKEQSLAHQRGKLDWVPSIDSTIVRVHQHGATLKREGLAPARIGSSRTRGTHRRRIAPGCVSGASQRRSLSATTRLRTAARSPADPSTSASSRRRVTSDATSSSDASTSSSDGAVSPPARTRPHGTSTPDSASPQPSNGLSNTS